MSALAKAREDLNKVADEIDQHVAGLIAEGGKHIHAGTIGGVVGMIRFVVDGLKELEHNAPYFTDALLEQAAKETKAASDGHQA